MYVQLVAYMCSEYGANVCTASAVHVQLSVGPNVQRKSWYKADGIKQHKDVFFDGVV